MKKTLILIFCLTFLYRPCLAQDQKMTYNRIVSLSPSITEILYELGLGDKVVGVTDFCSYPPDVNDKFRVGGYLNTNFESIIFLKPDLVISPSEYDDEIKKLFDATEIDHFTVNTQTVDSILTTIEEIGLKCGVKNKAREIVNNKRDSIKSFRERAELRTAKRIMIAVSRNKGSLENVYVAGKETFYSDLLDILGCENVSSDNDISYTTLSVESIMRMNPDIILEMAPHIPDEDKPGLIEEWKTIDKVNAVKSGDIHVLNGDYIAIPGPRFTLILRDIEQVL